MDTQFRGQGTGSILVLEGGISQIFIAWTTRQAEGTEGSCMKRVAPHDVLGLPDFLILSKLIRTQDTATFSTEEEEQVVSIHPLGSARMLMGKWLLTE